MQRKSFIYLLMILTLLAALLPISAAAQGDGPAAQETTANPALPSARDLKLASDGPAAPAAPAANPAAILYDNGPLTTHPGGGAGGADASAVQTALGNSTYGFGMQLSANNRVADDFTVPAGGWNISTITFYGYQTGSTTTSTMNHVNLRIWDGPPGVAGSNIVFGDTSTNRLAGSSFSNIYRTTDTALGDNQRPIMANVVTVNTTLPAGVYWLDWQTGGTLTSGPWAPPVTILGQTNKPGANAQQSAAGAAFAALLDTGNSTPQDLPFIIEGAPATGPSISLLKTVGTTPGVCAATSNITVPEGTTVYYCYTVTNTGTIPFATHDLTDTVLGSIFSGLSYALAPGASVDTVALGLSIPYVANANTTNVGTWTASHVTGGSAQASSTANVTVIPNRCPVGSTEVTLLSADFEGSFPPAGWSVSNTTTGCGASGVPDWTNTNPAGRSNLTGGSGLFAIADSDACGSGSIMNTQMWTSVMDLTGLTDPMVSYYTDYNDLGTGGEFGDLDFSTDGGSTWTNLLSWDEDHRGPLLVEEPFAADNQANTVVRWNYRNATWDWWWQVDSVTVTACEPDAQDEPNIYVDPLSMSSTQPADVQVQQTLTISNTGSGTLNWGIAEENTSFAAGVPAQGMNATVGSQTLSAAGSFASGMQPVAPVSRGVEALVNDGSFENGPPPASGWTEVTNSTCEWIGDWSGVWGAAAYDGSMDFWGAGYCGGVAATSSVDQMVAVPAGGATLSFWYMSYRPDPDDAALDYAYVEVNGTQVWSLDLIQANDTYPNWVNATVDLSAYAGQNVSLELGAVSQGTDTGNIRFDYVELGGPACSAPSDIPWLSLAPTSGANAGGTDTDVTVTFDSTGLAAGTYTGNLCVDSNDPDPGPGNETEMVVVPVALTVETQAGPPLVCNAPAVGFEEGVFPTGWSYTTLALPGGEWVVSTDNSSGFWNPGPAPEGVYYASANDDLPGSGSNGSADYLYTNIIDLSGATSASLDFWYHFNGDYGQTAGGVAVSGDGGATWGSETIVPMGDNWQTYTLDLSAYAGNNNVQVRFHSNDGGNWASGYAIDNVSLDCAQGNDPNIDVSPLSLSETHATPPQNTSQTLTVANTGGGTLNWSIAEEPASVLVRPDAPNAAVSAAAAGTAGSRGSASGGPAPLAYTSPADFSENFADISALPGWYMQNNSAPLGLTDWFQGNDTVFPAHAGAPTAYIGANFNNTAGAGTISNWLLTPELNLTNGDTISFWTRTAAGSIWADRLQVRLSTAGSSTNVGTLATDVGDFTTLLLDINPTLTASGYPQSWTQYTATLSGIPANATGRFAFRYFVTDGGPSGNNSNYIGIDTVEYTSAGGGQTCDAPADVSWLSLSPTSGANAGGTNTPVTVGFNSTGLVAGTYNANLCITSNDPDAGPGNGTDLVIVPVTLIVGNPTAVTLESLSAAQAPLPLAGLPLAALPAVVSMALGAAYVLRRRQ